MNTISTILELSAAFVVMVGGLYGMLSTITKDRQKERRREFIAGILCLAAGILGFMANTPFRPGWIIIGVAGIIFIIGPRMLGAFLTAIFCSLFKLPRPPIKHR